MRGGHYEGPVGRQGIRELNKKAYLHVEDWLNWPLASGRYPYVWVDGIYLRRNWGGEFENVAFLVAIAVNEDGFLPAQSTFSVPLPTAGHDFAAGPPGLHRRSAPSHAPGG